MRKKLLSMILATTMVATALVGCGAKEEKAAAPAEQATEETKEEAPAEEAPAEEAPAEEASAGGGKIGVAMPTKDLQRWNQDGANMKAELEAAGYEVDLQYAANDIATQVSQIENMINSGCSMLVIASIDGDSLGTVLELAKESDIPVIAYDRLIMNSDAVSYYATFDNYMVGTIQGEYIKDQLDLDNAEGPFNIELTTGDPGDNNARFFFGGAMDVLQPYIDSGKLVVKSGQTAFEEVATANWATDAAQARMDAIIAANYADGTVLHAALCSNDSTALGVANSLEANYTGEWPIITGQDCDIASVKNILAGKQSMSIFKDTRTLASKVVEMVDAVMKGGEAPINDTETYDNGTGIIPSFLCEPVFADINNYTELLIDSGYYTEDQLK
ncbi:MAG: sugar-binding protein [Eubacterium sp.]|nr:sugar-binding protein [Eubacterium sp.]